MQEELSLFDDSEYIDSKYELQELQESTQLIKSKERVQHHGEVFTPKWMVQKMLAEPAIQEKLHDLHATFLEPSAGEGAFLTEILHQKLNYVNEISTKNSWKNNALWALMSIYGIELLSDNLTKAKKKMLEVVANHYQAFMQSSLSEKTDFYKSVEVVIDVNIVQGNTLEYTNNEGELIEFSHWRPVDKLVKREPFTYKSLFNNDDIDDTEAALGQLSLFGEELGNARNYKLCELTKVYKEELIQ